MASIHVRILEVFPTHQPAPSPLPSPPMGERVAGGRVRGRFMFPMRAQKRKEASHEPRSSQREEAHDSKSEIRNPKSEINESLLTSAATVQGFGSRTIRLGSSL